MKYVPTIGLEIHAELRTRTKMFCDSKNDPDETRPNVNICPVCLAHPGTLPVINGEAVRHVLRVGAAIGGDIADYTEFDRKNYFYPDLPKGYQISQYEYPLVSGGVLNGIAITRVHLEEDTATLIHADENQRISADKSPRESVSLVDFNRAGVPLMELVTEPVLRSAEEAGRFARELQLLLRYLGASDADMEKGQMRVEANVSIAPLAKSQITNHKSQINPDEPITKKGNLGVKVEIKNLNSFRAMERAVAYEIERQTELLERGEKIIQETRGWDEKSQKTFSQRIKEESADYRYFPDPDLPALRLSKIKEFDKEQLLKSLPELPFARRGRYIALGLKQEDADMFVKEKAMGDFFESVIRPFGADRNRTTLAANYTANDLVNEIRDIEKRDSDLHPEKYISFDHFREIVEMLSEKKISSRVAKDILGSSIAEKRSPHEIALVKGLFQTSDESALRDVVRKIIVDNPKVVADIRRGKEAAFGFLVGAGMKSLKGAADPHVLRQIIRDEIAK